MCKHLLIEGLLKVGERCATDRVFSGDVAPEDLFVLHSTNVLCGGVRLLSPLSKLGLEQEIEDGAPW